MITEEEFIVICAEINHIILKNIDSPIEFVPTLAAVFSAAILAADYGVVNSRKLFASMLFEINSYDEEENSPKKINKKVMDKKVLKDD